MILVKQKLETIILNPTYRCNLKCEMCDLWSLPNNDDLSLDITKNILREAKKMGANRLNIYGGEPLINNDLFQILEYAHKLNYYILMTTNGTLIDESVARRLATNIDFICLSLEGTKECHDAIRGEGSFLLAKNGAKSLRKNSIKTTLKLVMVVSKISYKYMKGLVDLGEELNATYISYQPFFEATLFKRQALRKKFMIIEEEIPALSTEIENTLLYAKTKGIYVDDRIKNIPDYFRCGGGFHPKTYCINPFNSLMVQPNGDVWPCTYMNKGGNNVRDKSLYEIWNSDLFKEARERARNKTCPGCCCYTEPNAADEANKGNLIKKLLRLYKNK